MRKLFTLIIVVAIYTAVFTVGMQAGETVVRMTDINPGAAGAFPSYLTVFGNQLYFRATTGLQDTELWRFNGTNASRVADIVPGPNGSSPAYLAGLGANLYFDASMAGGAIRMHRFNGTTVTALSLNGSGAFWASGAGRPVEWNGALWWRSLHFQALGIARFDGSTISVLNSPPWANSEPVLFNGALHYGAQENATGTELWRYNGSSQQRLTDLNPGAADASPEVLFPHGGAVYFRARDSSSGNELWRYNGSTTQRVADLNPNGDSNPHGFASFGGALYFDADDGVWGRELWKVETNAAPRLTLARAVDTVSLQLNQAETGPVIIQGSSDLINWVPLATNRPLDGSVVFRDAQATNQTHRAYRAVRKMSP